MPFLAPLCGPLALAFACSAAAAPLWEPHLLATSVLALEPQAEPSAHPQDRASIVPQAAVLLRSEGQGGAHQEQAATALAADTHPGGLHARHNVVALLLAVAVLVAVLCAIAPTKRLAEGGRYTWEVPLFICAWIAFSTGLTVFNKWIFMPTGGNFPHVVTLTWLHMLATTLLTQVVYRLQPRLFPAVVAAKGSLSDRLGLVLPIGVLCSLVLVLGNAAYLYLSVSYIQMIKAAMPAMIFVLSAMVALERFSWRKISLLLVIILGVAGCSLGEPRSQFSWLGLGFQFGAFFCEAWRLIFMKLALSRQGAGALDPLSTLFYLAPVCTLTLSVPLFCHERALLDFTTLHELRLVLAANALSAFGLQVAGVCLLSVTSAVTYSVCGLVKDLGLIFGSTLVFGNVVTRTQVVSSFAVFAAVWCFQRCGEPPAAAPSRGGKPADVRAGGEPPAAAPDQGGQLAAVKAGGDPLAAAPGQGGQLAAAQASGDGAATRAGAQQ